MAWIAENKRTKVLYSYSDQEKSEMNAWTLSKFNWTQLPEPEPAPEPVAAKRVTNSDTDNGTDFNGRDSGEARRITTRRTKGKVD